MGRQEDVTKARLNLLWREKDTGKLEFESWEFQTYSFFSSPPLAPPFVVSMCFPCSSVEMKNNSRCSVKLCGRKSFRQVDNSDIIPSQALYLPWESSQAGHCHLWQQRPQMSLKGSPCSGPMNNTVTLELTTMNCSLILWLIESRAWLFSVFSGSTQCLGGRQYSVLISHDHPPHSTATSVFHILVNRVTV